MVYQPFILLYHLGFKIIATFKFYNVKNMKMSVMKTIYFVFIANEYF